MELLAILALCLILFLLIGVPWLALASRSEARAATRQVELLVSQIALLQRQIDQLRAGTPAAAEAPPPPQPADQPADAVAAEALPSAAAIDETVEASPSPWPSAAPRRCRHAAAAAARRRTRPWHAISRS